MKTWAKVNRFIDQILPWLFLIGIIVGDLEVMIATGFLHTWNLIREPDYGDL